MWGAVSLMVTVGGAFAALGAGPTPAPRREATSKPASGAPVADPKQAGGEGASVVQVANLIYARIMSSKCFSDHFLVRAEQESSISTSRRFHAVKLESEDLFHFPFAIITGEGTFALTEPERANLKRYCENGGFVLASAGCSSEEWNQSFRKEIARLWPETKLQPILMTHPVFHTVFDIAGLKTKHGTPRPLEGLSMNGKLVVLYSPDGLNNTANTTGCCCCGGNEIANAEEVNVNILAYALTF